MTAARTLSNSVGCLAGGLISLLLTALPLAAAPGDEVVVVFNKNLPDSRRLAEYYAQRRQIPKDQVLGFDLPSTETISRSDFEDRLRKPLLKKMREARWLVYANNRRSRTQATNEFPIQARIRYTTLGYGVPLKILHDPKINEQGADKLRPELRRTDAAVDNELALLPTISARPHLMGALPNRVFAVTNTAWLHPTNGVLLVGRLDGPSVEIARGLVDKAIQAEAEGLWGRAYFDLRGLTNSAYKRGDDWIRGGAQVAARLGFETIVDQEPATFSASFPMSHIALYAGWYDGSISGPFIRTKVEFMPGAFAYHLHSFSANTIRSASANWVGPLLAKGATITMGCVEEPYLEATPDVMAFLVRLIFFGFSFGEAAYSCQNSLSWQTTVVGDPLYRPFGRTTLERHEDLLRWKSKLIEWSHLRLVNINLANGLPPEKLIEYLEATPDTSTSAVLLEKLADLYFLKARWTESVPKYRAALAQEPSPQQQVRLTLSLARAYEFSVQPEKTLEVFQNFLSTFPDYPDPASIYRKLTPLAAQLGKAELKQEYQRQLDKLTAAANATKP